MLPINFDISIPQNVTRVFYLIWKNKQTGAPVDLTGYEAKYQIRKTFDSEALLTLQTGEYETGLVITPAAGRVDFNIDYTLTGLPFGLYRHDLYLFPAEPGILPVLRLFQGSARFTPRVTHV